jgi:hypothetical protein
MRSRETERNNKHHTDPGEIHNLEDEPTYTEIQMERLQRLLDQLNPYRAVSEFQEKAALLYERRRMPTELMHKRRLDWKTLQETYSPSAPGRGLWAGLDPFE